MTWPTVQNSILVGISGMIAIATVPDPDTQVSNLELETGDDFLLETGEFLLLE